MWSKVAMIVLVFAFASAARAQDAQEERYATWLGIFAHGPIADDAWLWVDVQLRLYESFETQQVLVRPGISWRILPELFATLGYAWTPAWTRGPDPREWGDLEFVDQHNIWQQVLYVPSDPANGVTGQLRLRVEERLRSAGPFEVGVRLRLAARIQAAVDRDKRVFVVAWDEAFIALSDAATWQRGGFDQNRFFFGLAWQAIPAQLRLELGYLNQWIVREGTDPVNHIASLSAAIGWSLPSPEPS